MQLGGLEGDVMYAGGRSCGVTDAQIITIAVTVVAILAGTLFNNSRLGDMNNRFSDINNRFSDMNNRFGDTNRRIDDSKELLRGEMKALEARIDSRFNSIDNKLDAILRIVGDHETRITNLEQRPGTV